MLLVRLIISEYCPGIHNQPLTPGSCALIPVWRRAGFCLSESLLLFLVEWTRQIIGLFPEKELLVPDRPLIGRTRAVFSVWRSYITIYTHAHIFAVRPKLCKSNNKCLLNSIGYFGHRSVYLYCSALTDNSVLFKRSSRLWEYQQHNGVYILREDTLCIDMHKTNRVTGRRVVRGKKKSAAYM